MESIQFEWDKFLPTLEKYFQEMLNKVLGCNNTQQQIPNSNKNRSTPNKNRNQYNTEINNRTELLTTPIHLATYIYRAHGFQHMSHSRSENNMYGGNIHLTHHMYQGNQNRTNTYHTAPFRSSHTDCDQ